jgi:hypothetical protein
MMSFTIHILNLILLGPLNQEGFKMDGTYNTWKQEVHANVLLENFKRRTLERLMYKYEDNIKMGLRETGHEDGNWIELA